MYMFLINVILIKIKNVYFANQIVNNTLFLTLGAPNFSSL
jgi:hypothetical protein